MDDSKATLPTTTASVKRDTGSWSMLKLSLCVEVFINPKDE